MIVVSLIVTANQTICPYVALKEGHLAALVGLSRHFFDQWSA